MELKMFLVVLNIAIFSCLTPTVIALKCYQCESTTNKNCTYFRDLITSLKPQECAHQSGLSPSCLKIVTSNNHRFTVIYNVVRQCVWKYQNQDPCASQTILLPYVTPHTTYQNCTTCSNKDGCNTASSLKFFSALAFFGTMLSVAISIS